MPEIIHDPSPATVEKAEALANEVHDRIVHSVVNEGKNFGRVFYDEVQISQDRWRKQYGEEITEHALRLVCDTHTLRTRIALAKPLKKSWWSQW